MKRRRLKKRFFTLLEVLLAASILVIGIIPLIAPHIHLAQEQMKFNHKVELDHQVNLYYAAVLEKLYRNEIPWESLKGGTFDVRGLLQEGWLKTANLRPLPYHSTYQFERESETTNRPRRYNNKPLSVHLVTLRFRFTPFGLGLDRHHKVGQGTPMEYTYKIFIVRDCQEILGVAGQNGNAANDSLEAETPSESNAKKEPLNGKGHARQKA